MRPPCSEIAGVTPAARSAVSLACVPSSSWCMSREYPATSAARIADSLRSTGTGRRCTIGPHSNPRHILRRIGLQYQNALSDAQLPSDLAFWRGESLPTVGINQAYQWASPALE